MLGIVLHIIISTMATFNAFSIYCSGRVGGGGGGGGVFFSILIITIILIESHILF